MELSLRSFNPVNEDPEKIFRLFETVYGDSAAIRERWEWEYIRHPQSSKIRILLSEGAQGDLAGMTVRMPCQLKVGGKFITAYFAINSMVSPLYRGQGLIRRLYMYAAEDGALHLSKGTTLPMQRQLHKMGYQVIEPNNFQVCVVRPFIWFMNRFAGSDYQGAGTGFKTGAFREYSKIDRFTAEFEDVIPQASASIVKSADEMNWRYIDPPHLDYQCYARRKNGNVVSWCALRSSVRNMFLSDIQWRGEEKDEPYQTIRFAKALARSHGAMKLTCWATHSKLRRALTKKLFFGRKESPGFNFFSKDKQWQSLSWKDAHFVHGDSDTDYV